jgi:hypothetical protein
VALRLGGEQVTAAKKQAGLCSFSYFFFFFGFGFFFQTFYL